MDKKIPIIACDFGYGYVKIYDGKNFISFKSLVSAGRNIRFNTGMANLTLLNCLNVLVDGKRYFVGDLAERQGNDILQVMDKDKIKNESTEILMKTGLGLLAKDYTEVAVVTGLPVSYYNDNQKEAMESILRKKHNIVYDKSLLKKNDEEVNFNVHFTSVVPQPIGTLWDLILDNSGNLSDKSLASKNLGIIDIGFGTTDFSVSKCLEYIDRSSKSVNQATHNVLELVAHYLDEQIGEEMPIIEIEKAIKTKQLSLRGTVFDLTEHFKKAVDVVFMDIKTMADSLWNKERQLDAYVITGGGANLFGERFKKSFGKDRTVIVPKMPDGANVRGFYKYMYRKMFTTKRG